MYLVNQQLFYDKSPIASNSLSDRMISMNDNKQNIWPDGFIWSSPPDIGARIEDFIDNALTALEELDEARAEWVSENLPEDYEMTYFFRDHTLRVAEDVKNTCLHMGLSDDVAENMYMAMLVHDIGKTQLPVDLWDMVEKPEDDIKAKRRSHTELGIEIVKDEFGDLEHPFIDLMRDIMLHHHEQMDGNGYLGLTGDKLSAPVRLACIVESFDGYSIARPHFGERDISNEGVITRMRDEKGAALYDMELFEAFAATKL